MTSTISGKILRPEWSSGAGHRVPDTHVAKFGIDEVFEVLRAIYPLVQAARAGKLSVRDVLTSVGVATDASRG